MNWAEKSKLRINQWLVTARWFYAPAVLLLIWLPLLLEWLSFPALRSLITSFRLSNLAVYQPLASPLLSLLITGLVANIIFDVALLVMNRRWKLLKPIAGGLSWLAAAQVAFDLTWLGLVSYFGELSTAIFPLFFFIPIVESIILFSLWGPILVAMMSAGLVIGFNYFFNLDFPLLAVSATAIYLIIGFFAAYLANVVRERGEILAYEDGSKDALRKQSRALEEQTKYQERSMSAKELELSLANQKLRELDEVRNRFISVTTHEMRTPLAGIKWTFSMLDSGQLGDLGAEAKGFIHKGAESVDHLIKIINDLLSVNKVDATSEELKLEKVAPVDLISDVVREFATQAVSRKISLNFVKPDWGVPLLDADRAKLRVVLENLIDNGLKYGRAGGQVTIMIIGDGLNTAEPKLEVTVTDSGIGINPADQGKIFHKFYRGASAVAVEPDGSGVGLYICRDLVEKHRGTIWFENRPGGGTVFHFTLPVSQKKV